MSSDKKFFFAARREFSQNGANLVLVDPWTGKRHPISETELRKTYGIELGNFVHACVDPMDRLYNISKTQHTARLWTKVDGNMAVVENLMSRLNLFQGELVFQNKLFGDALCTDKSLAPGEYRNKLFLREEPLQLAPGRTVHFEALDPEPKVPKPVVGTGFPIAAPRKDDKIVGAGFGAAPIKEEPVKMRAVVLSSVDKPIGTHYYLWNLDSRTESLFVSKEHALQQGHFFEGTFKKKPDGRMTCQKYEKSIEGLFKGGVTHNNKIYFTVKIENVQPAKGNSKRAFALAKYFGEVLEGETEKTTLTPECNGKMVNIQRRGIGGKDFVWMVTEIL